MYILGISAYYHDSAAVLLKDGICICAFEEERFTRIKHDNAFPNNSIAHCLTFAKISISDVKIIAFYEKPLLKFERILEMFVTTYPHALIPFIKSIPEWLNTKITLENTLRTRLKYKGKILYIPHHEAHAAAAYYTSPFKNATILAVDGVGEYETTTVWHANKGSLTQITSLSFPHSLGLLYSTFTAFLGFKVNEDEYKLMGLAAYGKTTYYKNIKKLIETKPDGSFHLKMRYFAFRETFQMWSPHFEKLLGKPRKPDEKIVKRHKDIAASIQKIIEECYFALLNFAYKKTGEKNICIAGGVALNALANGKLYKATPFKKAHVFGPAGDSGAAWGAALAITKKQSPQPSLSIGSYYSSREIKEILAKRNLRFTEYRSEKELVEKVAELISKNNIIGWSQGRMEFGPRALGNRSILANPQPAYMKDKVNIIKRREQFRPFAGSVLQECVHEYFDVPEKNHSSPYMNFCFPVRKEKQKSVSAIVHPDGTCRIQTVSKKDGIYYKLINEFYRRTGVPCILNTSFNLKGEPIVETPEQAIADFMNTRMDYLVLEDFLVSKS